MEVVELRIKDLRCFEEVGLEPCSGVNVLTGVNGAGKTSVLEALSLLSGGKSFRTSRHDVVVKRGAEAAQVFASVRSAEEIHRVGFRRGARSWEGRLDGEGVRRLSDLARCCAVLVFEPNALDLLTGPSEARRRFVDWLVFHVEQDYSDLWLRYQRTLNQRNALLKSGAASESALAAWDAQLAPLGEAIHGLRAQAAHGLGMRLTEIVPRTSPGLGIPSFRYRCGWDAPSLSEALLATRQRDRQLKFTGSGPHRSDWRLSFSLGGGRHELSRGQQKTACFMMVLAVMNGYFERWGCFPILCLDDLFSELDLEHQWACLDQVATSGAQVFVTGTSAPPMNRLSSQIPVQMFHVEHHSIRAVK